MCAVCFTSMQLIPAAGVAGRAFFVARLRGRLSGVDLDAESESLTEADEPAAAVSPAAGTPAGSVSR